MNNSGYVVLAMSGLIIGAVLRAAWKISKPVRSLNPLKLVTRFGSPHGSNAAGVLAAVALAQTAHDVLQRIDASELLATPLAVLLPVAMITIVFALVFVRKQASFWLALVGVGASMFSTSLDYGLPGALTVLAFALPLIWLFGFFRGFS